MADRKLELIKRYCKEYTKIENYDKALANNFEDWECHHKLEVHSDYKNTYKDLIMMNLYYNRPPEELIFMPKSEHKSLHHKGRIKSKEECNNIARARLGFKFSDEAINKMRESHKGKKLSEETKLKMKEAWRKRKENKCLNH